MRKNEWSLWSLCSTREGWEQHCQDPETCLVVAILYLSDEWIKASTEEHNFAGYGIQSFYDVQVAEIMRFYSVYAFDDPYFYQTSSDGNQTGPMKSCLSSNQLKSFNQFHNSSFQNPSYDYCILSS